MYLWFVKNFLMSLLLLGLVSLAYSQCIDGTSIASIELEGLEYTKPHVVWRELLHKAGGAFSQKTFETGGAVF